MLPTNTLPTFHAPVNMPYNNNNHPSREHYDAASTFSESTTYSDLQKHQPQTNNKRRSGLKQKVKAVFRDMGSNPFEYDRAQDDPAHWASTLPPART